MKDAENMAQALWRAARLGTVPPEALAKELLGPDAKASGGSWRNRMALFRVFGLVKSSEGGQLGLSDLGLGVVRQDDEPRRLAALRASVLQVPSYRDLL
ncbi:hypothetical protein B7486_72005, partial [cyanobacterium TDX16]